METTQEQMRNTLSNLQDRQAIVEDSQNSMDGQLRELDARIRTVKTTHQIDEIMEMKMQQTQDDVTQQTTTQMMAIKKWITFLP